METSAWDNLAACLSEEEEMAKRIVKEFVKYELLKKFNESMGSGNSTSAGEDGSPEEKEVETAVEAVEGEEKFDLKNAVPGKNNQELEQLFYVLRWIAGFNGGHLPSPELKAVFNAIDAVSPARVTGESHNWADAGRKFRKMADKQYASNIKMHRDIGG